MFKRLCCFLALFSACAFAQVGKYDNQVQAIYDEISAANSAVIERRGADASTKISAFTFNMGLVNGGLAYVPYYDQRKKTFIEALSLTLKGKNPPDVVFLQEIWYQDDFNAILETFVEAKDAAYIAAIPRKDWKAKAKNYWMQILVRKDILEADTGIKNVQRASYEKSRTHVDYWMGIFRGVLFGAITLKDGHEILVGTTHLSAGTGKDANEMRATQIDKLVKAIQPHCGSKYVLLGTDFNVSPEFELAKKGEESDWEENRKSYLDFFEKTHLVDTYKATGVDEVGYTWDKRTNILVSEGPKVIRNEPLQRVDFIFFGRLNEKELVMEDFAIKGSRLVYSKPIIRSGEKKFHLSDHFAVLSEISIFD